MMWAVCNMLMVRLELPAKTVPELIALLKANPGKYHYGTPGVGTVHHLTMEILQKQAGVQVTHVPYKGGTETFTALMTGEVQVLLVPPPAAIPAQGGTRCRCATPAARLAGEDRAARISAAAGRRRSLFLPVT